LAVAFIYVTGPEMYRRATQPTATQQPPGFTEQQVNDKIAAAINNLNSQLTESNRQRDTARREAEVLRQQIQNAPPPPRPNYDEPRTFTKKTIAELRAFYDGRTPLQGDLFMADEGGKWITTDGAIQNVLTGGQVVLRKDYKGISCFFDLRIWRPKLSVLRQNETITVTGKLRDHEDASMIYLDSCELNN
jgi:hypothetical protein